MNKLWRFGLCAFSNLIGNSKVFDKELAVREFTNYAFMLHRRANINTLLLDGHGWNNNGHFSWTLKSKYIGVLTKITNKNGKLQFQLNVPYIDNCGEFLPTA